MGATRSRIILLVEDDTNDVFLMRRALTRAGVGIPVKVVRDGSEAIAYLAGTGFYADRQRHPVPCLVLLDIKLPKRSGLEVLKWLRNREELKDLPVFMISSSNHETDQQQAAEQGVEAYRIKPISFVELVRLAQEIRTEVDDHCQSAEPCSPDASGSATPGASAT